MAQFPTTSWPDSFMEKLNNDEKYNQVARNWEGDFYFVIEPSGNIKEQIVYYLDLWHGKCRCVEVVEDPGTRKPAFVLKASYDNFSRVIKGDLHPMQAMMTRKLNLQGNMAVLMRNIPTVLEFVRCAREVTDSFV